MNILVLVGTLEQHADIVDAESVTLSDVDKDAGFNELLNSHLTTSFFWFQKKTRFPLGALRTI